MKASISLASVTELQSRQFAEFMNSLNSFARSNSLREFVNWSKVWEYPWLWFRGLSSISWKGKRVCDLGSEISPMPWYLASLGADVVLVETDRQFVKIWESIRSKVGWRVGWKFIEDELLPFSDREIDVVTSFSVIEHQPNKALAIDEVARVLKSGGLFAISFDICEPSMGMTFPDWNGKALTMKEFEDVIWKHPAFNTTTELLAWNVQGIPDFIRWHLQSAPHHNYTTGAALLVRK